MLAPVAMKMLASEVTTTNTTTNSLASADVPKWAANRIWNVRVVR